jgi:lipoprotein-releasing system ATP-binding protein
MMNKNSNLILETKDIKKSFITKAGELHVLKGINLKIFESEIVAIVGASGAGKSTLLHILGTLDSPTSGKVFYKDIDIFTLDKKMISNFRNRHIGFVFQFHHLLPEFTALENVAMPALISKNQNKTSNLTNKEIIDKAEYLLEQMGLIDKRHQRPGELSGGEQQRVAVARALILDPPIVLADEPTGNLDTPTGKELLSIFLNLNKTKRTTFVIVTHNELLAKQSQRILKITDGIILENNYTS